jgi:O-succinylbenzoic acid--CoA ligase
MIPTFDNVHLKFKLNSISYNKEALKELAYSLVKEGQQYEKNIGNFLLEWLDDKAYLEVKTSGSTGAPKRIHLSKQAMVNSSIATGNYLKLEPGNTALHCLPTHFIAGKMMLVRAMILGLEIDLVAPTSQPVFDYDKVYHFVALLPMQLKATHTSLHNVRHIIVGGATVSTHLIDLIQSLKAKVYATFGMTETATHIALKPLNNKLKEPYFTVLPDVSISQDERGCLVIDAPKICNEKIVTNDIVKLHSKTEFEWLGRYDNVINSGGIKFFPEQIEEKLRRTIEGQFFIASKADAVLGEKLILVLESDATVFDTVVFNGLEKYEEPKEVCHISKFKMTPTGKIRRSETLKHLK